MSPSSLVPFDHDSGNPERTTKEQVVARVTPLHERGEMPLIPDVPLREECWAAMSQEIRGRLLQRAGTVLEWWADQKTSEPDPRPHAVVFGEKALCIAEPRLNSEHRPVYAVSAYEFDPASFRSITIAHRPPQASETSLRPPHAPRGAASPDLELSSSARALLGNLPAKAQELLQAPFLRGQRVLRCLWYYEGYEHRLDMFMVFLAGPKHVTVANGTKMIPAGHDESAAHWNLTCRRASVIRRVGK